MGVGLRLKGGALLSLIPHKKKRESERERDTHTHTLSQTHRLWMVDAFQLGKCNVCNVESLNLGRHWLGAQPQSSPAAGGPEGGDEDGQDELK